MTCDCVNRPRNLTGIGTAEFCWRCARTSACESLLPDVRCESNVDIQAPRAPRATVRYDFGVAKNKMYRCTQNIFWIPSNTPQQLPVLTKGVRFFTLSRKSTGLANYVKPVRGECILPQKYAFKMNRKPLRNSHLFKSAGLRCAHKTLDAGGERRTTALAL